MVWMPVAVVLGAGRWRTGPAGCGRWSVFGVSLCWFVVDEGVLVLCSVLGSLGRRQCLRLFGVCLLVRVLWRPVWVLVAVLVWVS